MPQLPKPVRAYLGLWVTAVDGARELPRRVAELPVVAASSGARATLRLGQRYAELVTRGDGLISRLQGSPEDPPAWATFDEDVAPTAEFPEVPEVPDLPEVPEPSNVLDLRESPTPSAPRGRAPSAFDTVVDDQAAATDEAADAPERSVRRGSARTNGGRPRGTRRPPRRQEP